MKTKYTVIDENGTSLFPNENFDSFDQALEYAFEVYSELDIDSGNVMVIEHGEQ